ncbi:hypothetical protein THRCLA_22557 [Thraustotheca clavata]|uniref:Uncharacterized protein n=1 Tax=Thraustotheca clavata TaxID=74557 RepID=A0A1V9YX92_9STRA|nr:hypothetical protein THRCLA_22557 [Thraustotheca clavata]
MEANQPKTSVQDRNNAMLASKSPPNTLKFKNGTMAEAIPFDGASITASDPVISQLNQTQLRSTESTITSAAETILDAPEMASSNSLITNILENNTTLAQSAGQDNVTPKDQTVETITSSNTAQNTNVEIPILMAPVGQPLDQGMSTPTSVQENHIATKPIPTNAQASETPALQSPAPLPSDVSVPNSPKALPIAASVGDIHIGEENTAQGSLSGPASSTAVIESSGAVDLTETNVNTTLESSWPVLDASHSTTALTTDPLNRYPVKLFEYTWSNNCFDILPIPRSKSDFHHELRSVYMPAAKRLRTDLHHN